MIRQILAATAIATSLAPIAFAGTVGATTPLGVTANVTIVQNFDTLATAGTSSVTPPGWYAIETGSSANVDTSYGVTAGTATSGDTFSVGTGTSTDRGFGTLLTGTFASTIFASFTNASSTTFTSLTVSYTGEQWRLGTAGRTIADSLAFGYSLNGGAFTNVSALDFVAPTAGTVGARDGNAVGNRSSISATLSGLNIAANDTFAFRWIDTDASGSDDILAIDDFSLQTSNAPAAVPLPSAVAGGIAMLVSVGFKRIRRRS